MQKLSGVGPQLATRLEKIGIAKPIDLLFHLPTRYQDRTHITAIANLRPGETAVIAGQVDAAEVRFGKRRSLLVSVSDESGSVLLRFFHFSRGQQSGFREGAWIQCFGEARRGARSLELVHPEYKISPEPVEPVTENSLTPVYPTTEGLGPAMMRKLVQQALDKHLGELEELLPEGIRNQYRLTDLRQAVLTTHRPPPESDTAALMLGIHPAQQRLVLEELLGHRLALSRQRKQRQLDTAPSISGPGKLWSMLQDQLDFTLTGAQSRVVGELLQDLSRDNPGLRLVQGDVGSGKTIVAAAAALITIEAGFQVALMAPTELLAEQHRHTFKQWFDLLGVHTEWLTGKLPAAQRRQALERIQSGEASMVIGTHALFQDKVEFRKLGLLVIDEQHRFGVDQRLALRAKGRTEARSPHQIIMSATPIPRSLAMILYADLDVSSIDELPPGRKPVKTVVLPSTRRTEVAERIRRICESGQQAYWVCPLIDESEKIQAQAATEVHAILKSQLPALQIELIHGRLKSKEKERIMERFNRGVIDLLVSTTVIEVGVDVPNASLMIIENAERLGLAQLHQLRGRVGRGSEQASCVLMYDPPLGSLARERLGILRDTNDGFKIARKDLEQRGPGELLGTRQTGLQQLKIADLARDKDLIPLVDKIARSIETNHPALVDRLVARWLPSSEKYSRA